ncbi:MAG: glycosyltransferase [Chloroflexi bacterium]|nr:glycosyltransferase [Chloroflexota bacterium]
MRLLLLTPQLPYPLHQGTTIRNFNIIKHLAPRHEITLLSFGTPEELASAEPLRALCRRIEIAPYPTRSMLRRALTTITSPLPDMALRLDSVAMHARFDALMQHDTFDLLQIEGIEMAPYILKSKIENRKSKVVFDDHNAEYVLQRTAFESDARNPKRWHAALYSWIQWQKLARYERNICRRAHHIIAASATDARAIQQLTTNNYQLPVTVIPNGVDTHHFVPSDKVCAKPLADVAMVYAGKMDFRPNVDAILWFCDEILPRIRTAIPLAHLVIVGQKPAPRIRALGAQKGVEVTGWVPDTRPFIADAAVYVVPLRMGSGTRLKVLEAMAMGKAIVSTTRGAEGLDLVPGREALIADTPDEFARTAISLLRDPDRRRALGRAARLLVESIYDWRAIVPRFEQVYKTVDSEQ